MLVALLLTSTLGEGGDYPPVMLLVHGAVAAIWAVLLFRPHPAGSPMYRPVWQPVAAFAVFLGIALAGSAVAGYGYGAFMLLQELAVFTAVALLASRIGPGLLGFLAMPVLATGCAQAILVLVQRFVLGESRPAGTFLNTNHLGAWFAAALLFGFGALAARRERRLIISVALALPIVAALVVSESRGAILGLAAGAAVLVALTIRRGGAYPRPWLILISALCLLVIVMTAVGIQRIRNVDPYASHRLRIWQASLSMIADHPWLGSGPGQFASTAEHYQFDDGAGPLRYDRVFTRPHSDWLRLPSEFGLPGAAALLLALVLAIREAGRRLRAGEAGTAGPAAAAALAALLVHGAVENLSERPAVYILAAVLLGALLSKRSEVDERPVISAGAGNIPAVPGIACLTLVVVFMVGDLAPFAAWRLTEKGEAGEGALPYVVRLEAALRFNPLQPYLWMRRAEVLAGSGAGWDIGIYAEAREAAERAVRLHPRDGSLRLRLARLEALACRTLFGDLESRTRAGMRFLDAEELSRPSALLALETGEFLYGTSDLNGAIEAAERAIALEPEAPAPRLLEARALLHLEKVEEARTILAEAEELAARHRLSPRENIYTRLLLDLDPSLVNRVRDRLTDADQSLNVPEGS